MARAKINDYQSLSDFDGVRCGAEESIHSVNETRSRRETSAVGGRGTIAASSDGGGKGTDLYMSTAIRENYSQLATLHFSPWANHG